MIMDWDRLWFANGREYSEPLIGSGRYSAMVQVSEGMCLINRLWRSSGCVTGWLRNYHLWFYAGGGHVHGKGGEGRSRKMNGA